MGVGGVLRIEVTERERPVFGGAEFGAVGPYERLHGTIFGELDPTHPLNVGIVNLDRAARNAHGNVEYQSDFRMLKPLDLDRGNGCLVYDVPNRGNQPIMPRLNGAPDGGHPQHAGNGFLMRRGFTLVWSGWQGDVPPGADRLTARFPIIPGITGMVREEFIAENTGLQAQLLTQAREAGAGDERQRMAREIHDTIAQGLTGIVTQLEAARQTSNDAEIVSGLEEGERVVVSDRSGLKAGQKIRAQVVAAMEYQDGSTQ